MLGEGLALPRVGRARRSPHGLAGKERNALVRAETGTGSLSGLEPRVERDPWGDARNLEASSAENVVTRRVTDGYGGRGRARLICILRIVGCRPVRFRCRNRGTPDRRGVRKAGCNLHSGNPSTRLFVLTCPWFSILSVSSGAFG